MAHPCNMTGVISELGPIDLFWLPLVTVMIGLLLVLTRNPRFIKMLGALLAFVGFCFILCSPWTLPESPSSAFGQLLMVIAGPTLLIVITFVANIMEEELTNSKFGKFISAFSIMFGLLWFLLIWAIPPQWNNLTNPYWLNWWATFLLVHTTVLCLGTTIITKGSVKLGLISSLAGIILILAFSLNGSGGNSELEFRNSLVTGSLNLFGTLVGLAIGIIVWFKCIQFIENKRVIPPLMEPLNTDELKRVREIINSNIYGGGIN